MKKIFFFLFLLFYLVNGKILYAFEYSISLTNSYGFNRVNEAVEAILPPEVATSLPSLALYDEKDVIIPYQLLSGTEKIVFQATVNAWATVVYKLKDGTPATTTTKTYAAQKIPSTRNDIAWENDLSANRMYSKVLLSSEPNTSNGVDLWSKKQAAPIIDAMYGYTSPDYHTETAERAGMDVYSVGGKTLGSGGIVAYANSKLWLHDPFDECTIVANGPLQSEFILTYKKVEIDGDLYTKTVRITTSANGLLNKAVVKYEGNIRRNCLKVRIFPIYC